MAYKVKVKLLHNKKLFQMGDEYKGDDAEALVKLGHIVKVEEKKPEPKKEK